MYYSVNQIYPSDSYGLAMVDELLKAEGIRRDDNLDYICGIYDVVVGTNVGTVTNGQGKFSLTLPANKTQIRVTYVGMQTNTMTARDGMVPRRFVQERGL